MAKKAEIKINLADPEGVTESVFVIRHRNARFHLIPDPDRTLLIGSAEVKLQLSMDNENFFDHTATLSNSAPGSTSVVDITGVHAFRFRTSTADGSADNAALIKVFLQ